jgi:hypothetical protein
MRPLRLFVGATLLVTLAGTTGIASAEPTLALTWNSCTGPVHRAPAGPGLYSLYASIIGLDRPHKAYEIWLWAADSNGGIPDAWNFTEAGCQGPARVALTYVPDKATAASCPALNGDLRSLQISTVDGGNGEFPAGSMRMVIAIAYPDGVWNPDPGQRYFMARFDFDLSSAVAGAGSPGETCGGLDQGMTFHPEYTNFLDAVSLEEAPIANAIATFGGSSQGGTVPAQVTSWGRIKNQYR